MSFDFLFAGGKLCQRDNMPLVELVKIPERYFQLPTPKPIHPNENHPVCQRWRGDDFIPNSDKKNVVITAFTTAMPDSNFILSLNGYKQQFFFILTLTLWY